MTLASMIASHDDSALEALASKGLLRRAQRDLESGVGNIEAVDEVKATVVVSDLTVELVAQGPASSSCTCKAHGLCRHIVLAVLLLRRRLEESGTSDKETEPTDAVTLVCALNEEKIVKFAGKDWDKAVALSSEDLNITFDNEDINITVRIVDLEASVTFIAGNDLKGAAYKGLKTRKRLLTTLAALAVRRRAGLDVTDVATNSTVSAGVSAEFIDQAQQTIERAVTAILASRSLLGYDALLDLAISTRCEALPRLSGELRALAKQAQLANERSIEFEPDSFVLDASRSYALLEVLRAASPDDALGGSLRRQYAKHEPIEVWPLGVTRWRSGTGARGLTAYAYTPGSCRWLTLTEGRAAGSGGSFDVSSAYSAPVWSAGTLNGLMGRRVRLPEPLIAHDGAISSKADVGSEILKTPLQLDELMNSPATHRNWQSLREDLAERMGTGIRRRLMPIPALIAPSGFGRLGFDDMNQRYNWDLNDNVGESLILEIPADDDQSAVRLWRLGKKISALVVEARLEKTRLTIRPVAVLQKDHGKVSVHNLDFDPWPIESGLKKALTHISESVAKPLATPQTGEDPVEYLLAEVAEHLAGLVSGSVVEGLASIRRRLEGTGLVTLDNALEKAAGTQDVRSQLRAAYITSELKSMLALGGLKNSSESGRQ